MEKITPHLWFDHQANEAAQQKLARVTEAFLQMKKFDLATLERAYEGR